MVEIGLTHYNEMLRYEKDMDVLRALALWITRSGTDVVVPGLPSPREYIFDIIKFYSRVFAVEIKSHGSISPEAISRFHSALFSLNLLLGISEADIIAASEQQRYKTSGFWEMRRVIGQLRDVAEYAKRDGVTHIIAAAVSGCIIAEYLGLLMEDKYGYEIKVDHMVFSRLGPDPVEGILPEDFSFSGSHVLIVDDAVMEATTLKVMVAKLCEIGPGVQLSVMTVDVDPDILRSGYLGRFAQVYTFEE